MSLFLQPAPWLRWRSTSRTALLWLAMAAAACMAASTAHAAPGERPGAAQLQHAKQALQGLSMPFEANSGQFDPAVAFMGRTFAGAVHVTHQGQIVYGLPGPDTGRLADWARSKAAGGAPKSAPILRPGWSLTETLVGALPLSPSGGEAAGTQITRFSGPHRYQPATYRNLHLGQAWTGVQVELAVRGTNVEKLFHVAPQADPGQIQVRVDGALSLRLGEGGELVAATGHGDVAYTAPVAFQEVAGQRVEVPVQYALNSQGDGYGFALGAYDRALPLVIDPLLQSIYLGSPESSWIEAIATAAPSGDVLLAGTTLSNRFPGTAGGAQPASPPGIFALHGFVARLSSDLSRLIQSTYLSGSWGSQIHALAVTASGDVVVSGETMSSDFPGTAGGAQPVSLSVPAGFVARLSGDLRTLEQSTYLTGDGWVVATALALPASGEVVVAGDTLAKDLPRAANGAQPALSADRDGFVMRLSADLRTVVQSTYLGGTGAESISNIAIGPSGEILAGGQTQSPDLPATAHAAQPDISGDADGFIALLSGDLRTLVRSSYLGGNGWETLSALAFHPSGEIVAAGQTSSSAFPGTSGGAQPASNGNYPGYITRLSADLRTLLQSTYLGGANPDWIAALAIAPSGEILVAGNTSSDNFPGMAGAIEPVYGGGFQTGYVARLSDDLRTLEQSTYLGASGLDGVTALHITASGELLAGGYSGALFTNPDAFVSLMTVDLRALSPQTITFGPQASQVLGSPGSTFTIDPPAMASSGLPVDYGSATPAICTVSGTTVTMLDDGICTLVARQAGNAQWQAADANADVRIRRAQAIRFPAQASRSFEAGTVFAIDPPATASSGLPVEYASTTPGICTVSGNRVTMAGEGICTVTASQPGDARWMPATGVAQDIELTAVVPPPVTPPVIPPVTPPVTPPVPPPAPAPIPALGAWPLALLGAMAAGFGAHALRRRGVFSARQIPAPRLRTGRHRSSGSC